MADLLKTLVQYTAYAAEGASALIIIIGGVQALWLYLRRAFSKSYVMQEIKLSRLKLGHALSLALEFLIGADILKTAIAPSWSEIGQLAAIVAIRTVLNFFLTWELKYDEIHDRD